MVRYFNDLLPGEKFTLTRNSTKSYEKIEDFYYERNGNVYSETSNCRVYPLLTREKINHIRKNNRARYDVIKSTGMRRTPYGWE